MEKNLTQELIKKNGEKTHCHASTAKAYEQMKKAQAEKNKDNGKKKPAKMIIER